MLFSVSPKNTFLAAGLLAIITFLVYSPVLGNQFLHLNDPTYVTENSHLQNTHHLRKSFSETVNGEYMPLTTASFIVERHLFDLKPFNVHLDNVFLHMGVVILIFLLGQAMGLAMPVAFLGALVFALHPMYVESVAWICQRKILLYSFFFVAALLCYLYYLKNISQRQLWWASIVLFLLSMLSSPMAFTFPLAMLLLDWQQGRTVRVKDVLAKLPFWLIAIIVGCLTIWRYSWSMAHAMDAVFVWIWNFIFYLRQWAFPLNSLIIYSTPKSFTIDNPVIWFSIFIFIGSIVMLWRLRHRRFIIFAFAWYAITIFCVLPLRNPADHWMYLPSLGLSILLALAVESVYRFLTTQEQIIRLLFIVGIVALLAGLTSLTYAQTFVWRDDAALWKHQIQIAPTSKAFCNLANTYRRSQSFTINQVQVIKDLYAKAIAIDPQDIEAYYELADFYKDLGDHAAAIQGYKKVLVMDAHHQGAYLGLGDVYQITGNVKETIGTYNDVIKLYPDDEALYIKVIGAYGKAVEANPGNVLYKEKREDLLASFEELSKRKRYTAGDYFNLAFLYSQVGAKEEAERFYTKAVQLQPTYAQALYNLADLYQDSGDLKTALALYERLVHIYPKYSLAYLNMGTIFNALGDHDRAKQLYLKVTRLDPDNGNAYFYLGYLSESEGDLREATNYYEKAIEVDPKNPEPYYNLGNVYANLGQTGEAIALYLKTVAIDPKHQDAFVNLSILSFKSHDFPGAIHYLEQAQVLGYTPPVEYLKTLEPYRKEVKR